MVLSPNQEAPMPDNKTAMSAAESLARRCDPELWAMDPPDLSASHGRQNSLIRARVRLGEIRWNADTELYEDVKNVAS